MMIKGTQEDTTNMWPERSTEEIDKKNFVKKWEDTNLDTFLCTFDDTDCFGKVAYLKNNRHIYVKHGQLYVVAENMESVIRKYPEAAEIKKLGPGDYII